MKPTQQEIIDLAREAGIVFDERAMPYYERLVHLALERFGAGGGGGEETVLAAVFDENLGRPKLVEGCPELYHGQKLYPHPSPTDLRAEYLRGLEDAAKVCDERDDDYGTFSAGECADAIRALKGKQ